ncbi:hypothetical protein SLEP1_g44093 [Rubroshorea leprosula]|uniref:Uncharacterized protein n=1 Tax=Rubroshorea leprosula TaxID=152421 RepID=A0AAV5LG86_9ROSI|nr:hypothetical protein SLEP1_g44093 [Rubroshorea leprosula]
MTSTTSASPYLRSKHLHPKNQHVKGEGEGEEQKERTRRFDAPLSGKTHDSSLFGNENRHFLWE